MHLPDLTLGGFGGNDQEKLFVWTVPDRDYTFTMENPRSAVAKSPEASA